MSVKLNAAALKRFCIDHGEKGLLGLSVLLVLGAWWGTNWTPYSRTPVEIQDRVARAEAALIATPWPDEERETFAAAADRLSPRLVADRALRAPILLADYLPSQRMQQKPGPGYWPLEEPVYGVVQHLIADSGRALLRLAPTMPVQLTPKPETELPLDAIPDEFQSRNRQRGTTTAPRPGTAPAAAIMPAMEQQATLRGQAYPLVSVRGVFDVKAQIRAYVDAIHKGYAEAAREFEVVDFQLQRQRLLAGRDYWSDWRTVDVEVFYDVISACDGLEPDVVSAEVTDSALTCPLPPRVTGRWNSLATHPRLENFELSDEELARELAYLKALVAQARTRPVRPTAGPQKRGFTDLVQDAGQITAEYFGSAAHAPVAAPQFPNRFGSAVPAATGSATDEMIRRLAREIDPQQTDRQLQDWIRERATAAGDLLLFRYLDFDVDPGEVYRYRVRLEIRNPNYRKPLALAGGAPHVIEGETRLTPWSEPTAPIRVQDTTNAFLARMEPVRNRVFPTALMNVFQYDLETGTTVRQQLPVAFGQFVGGQATAQVMDPVKSVVEDRDYRFHSDDVLIDGLADLAFPLRDHPDLEMTRDSRGHAGYTEFAVMVDDDQQLFTIDTATQRRSLDRFEQQMQWQAEQFRHLREPTTTLDGVSSEYEQMYQQLYGAPASGATTPPRRPANPLQTR